MCIRDSLTPEQYACNVVTKPGGREPVEFAIRLPGEGSPVWLPIDAKFPLDAYGELVTAAESGDRKAVETASAALLRRLDSFAKDIRDKYVSPPDTTDFAILFLPTEALYAEVVRLGAVETLQRKYRVSIAGPTTMGALLNSLQKMCIRDSARIAQGGNFPLAGFKFVKRNKAAVGACGIVRHLADA